LKEKRIKISLLCFHAKHITQIVPLWSGFEVIEVLKKPPIKRNIEIWRNPFFRV